MHGFIVITWPQCKDRITYHWNYFFPYLLQLGLAQDRCRMKVDLLLPATGKQGTLMVDIDKVWIHASHQGCLHHGPVLRVHIHIADITAPTGPHKTWGENTPFQILIFIHSTKKWLNQKCLDQLLSPTSKLPSQCRLPFVFWYYTTIIMRDSWTL